MKELRKLINEIFYLTPLQMVVVAVLTSFVFWGFLILIFSMEVK
jgi:hypothetical protein